MEVLLIYFSIIITPGERLDWCYSSGLSSVFFLLVLFKITKKRWGDDSPLFFFSPLTMLSFTLLQLCCLDDEVGDWFHVAPRWNMTQIGSIY